MAKFGQGIPQEVSPDETLAIASAPDALAKFVQKFSGVTDGYFFYNGTVELRFSVKDHIYYEVGPLGDLTPLDNVSSICHIIDKSMALVPWAAKMVAEKVIRTVPVVVDNEGCEWVEPITSTDFFNLVMEAKTAPKDVLEDAGDVGHIAHKCIEESILFALANDPEKKVRSLVGVPAEPRAASCAFASKKWMDAHNVRWVLTECKVFSKEHKYAGTMDGLCIVDSCSDPACCAHAFKDHLSIADWKSSNYLYLEYIFQVSAYKAGRIEEFPEEKIVDCWVLRLGKEDGEFEPWHLTEDDFPADFAGFLECLALSRKVALVGTRLKGQKKLKREIKKTQKAEAKAQAQAIERDRKAAAKAAAKNLKDVEKAAAKAAAKILKDVEKAAARAAKLAPKTMPKLETPGEPQGAEPAPNATVPEGQTLSPTVPATSGNPQPSVRTDVLELSPEASRVFIEALLNPPPPNPELREALTKFRAGVEALVTEAAKDAEVASVLNGIRTESEERPSFRKPFVIPMEG